MQWLKNKTKRVQPPASSRHVSTRPNLVPTRGNVFARRALLLHKTPKDVSNVARYFRQSAHGDQTPEAQQAAAPAVFFFCNDSATLPWWSPVQQHHFLNLRYRDGHTQLNKKKICAMSLPCFVVCAKKKAVMARLFSKRCVANAINWHLMRVTAWQLRAKRKRLGCCSDCTTETKWRSPYFNGSRRTTLTLKNWNMGKIRFWNRKKSFAKSGLGNTKKNNFSEDTDWP